MPRSGPHHYGAYERAHKGDTADRMAARRLMIRTWAKKHDETIDEAGAKFHDMDVDHIHSLKEGGAPRSITNLRFRSPHANRADKTFND